MPVSRRVKLFLLWPLLVLAVIGALLRIALGTIAEYAITDWFAQQGIESEIEDISFILRRGELQLEGLSAGSPANPLLEIGELNLDWRWLPLLDNRIRINEVNFADVFIDIERGEDNALVIASIDLAGDPAAEPATVDATSTEPPAWTIDFGDFEIENFKHCYRAPPAQDYCG